MTNEFDSQEKLLTEMGRQEMEAAAYSLPIVPSNDNSPIRLYIVAGDKHWYQAAFCLWSFVKASGRSICPVIIDDGTMKLKQAEALHRTFPTLKILSEKESLERLDEFLPAHHYPSLRAQHKVHPLYKKILDIHGDGTGWKLQLDADILFFRSPDFLLKWYDEPYGSLYSEDLKNAYSSSTAALSRMLGCPVRERVNSGLISVRSVDIDWEQMEFWSKKLVEAGGFSHFLEQTLFALHLTGRECVVPDPKDYVLLPEAPEGYECKAIMHHYVAHAKKWHFQKNWKLILKTIQEE